MADDKYNVGAAPVDQVIADLIRRVAILEQSPRLQNASINAGALTVRDPNGVVQVRIGLLSDGTYGIEVLEAGSYHQVPFIYSDFVATQESTQSGSFVDLTTLGPQVSVPVRATGKLLVITGCTISVQPGANFPSAWGGFMSLNITGANTIAPTSILGTLGYIFGDNATGQSFVNSASRVTLLSGLNPGLTTIKAQYAVNLGGPPETALFRNRALAVMAI